MHPAGAVVAAPAHNAEQLQAIFVQKTQATVSNVFQLVVTTLMTRVPQMKPHEFVAEFVDSKNAELASLDNRTDRFFKKVVGFVTMDINQKIPPQCINPIFERIGRETGKANLLQSFIQGLALPPTKTLIHELDAINTKMIDDVLAAEEAPQHSARVN